MPVKKDCYISDFFICLFCHRSLVPSVLYHSGMLVRSCEQLDTLKIKWPTEKRSSASLISDVPVEIINMWKPLIEALDKASSEFIASVIFHFLENQLDVPGSQTEDISHGYAGWVKHLLESKGEPSLVLTGDLPWVNLLKIALDNPTLYSVTFIPLILENIPSIDAVLKEKLQRLVAIFLGPFSSVCGSFNDLEKSQDVDLEGWMASRKETFIETSLQQSEPTHGWQVSCDSTQWHLIPCGEVLGTADVSPNNLELPPTLVNP